MRMLRPTGPWVPRASGLFVRRSRQRMILLLSFRLMRVSPRFVHSVLKIGKGSSSPLRGPDPCLLLRPVAPTSHQAPGLGIAPVQSSKHGGWLVIPATPRFEVCCFCHGERRREARKEVTVVLAIGHTLRAHEALSRPDTLPDFLEVVHRLSEDGAFVGHDRSIRTPSGSIRPALALALQDTASYDQCRS